MRHLDRFLDFEERNSKAISILLGAWFIFSCAVYARFITLPKIPYIPRELPLWLSAAFNGLWWGFMYPAIGNRRAERAALSANQEETESGAGEPGAG